MSSGLVVFITATILVALVVLTVGHLFGLLAFLTGVAVGVVIYSRGFGRLP